MNYNPLLIQPRPSWHELITMSQRSCTAKQGFSPSLLLVQ